MVIQCLKMPVVKSKERVKEYKSDGYDVMQIKYILQSLS